MMSLGLGLAEPSGAHTPLLVTQGRVTFGLFIYGLCVKQKRRHAYHLAVKIPFYNLNTAPPLVRIPVSSRDPVLCACRCLLSSGVPFLQTCETNSGILTVSARL